MSVPVASTVQPAKIFRVLLLLSTVLLETETVAVVPLLYHPVPVVEPLTQRETEVLRLIAEGLSNREIAQRLYISLSTVKRHNATIYDKLAVNNRTQAVARGRDLGLLKQ